jgi:hypothetical protein
MLSPGGGAGNQAAAASTVKAVTPTLIKAMLAYEAGSKEFQALNRAIAALAPVFGKPDAQNTVPAAIAQMVQNAKQGGPIASAPPPGLATAPIGAESPSPGPV